VFDLSTSNNLRAPSVPISFTVMRENEMNQGLLPLRLSEVREVFDLSASDNMIAPSLPILLSVLSENEMKQQICYH
jgi:hypothetical protein